MIKLTISHGLAQSVKLASFENIMEETIEGTIPLPRMMAKYGEVKMQRTDVMKIIGKLYKLRMNVNLVSNVLGMYRKRILCFPLFAICAGANGMPKYICSSPLQIPLNCFGASRN